MNTIENYLNNILAKQLKEFDVDDAVCSTVVSDIRKNMLSLLQYWHDEKFKKTILLIGLEEGRFYEPNANTEVKCFVVVTIRNSKLETLASDNYCALNAKRIIEDYEIKAITSYAIKYFSDVDFNELSLSLDYKNINNIYIALKEKYQMAWNAFESIGNTKRKRVRYNRITSDPDSELICLIKNTYNAQYKLMSKTVLDGYDESLDDDIINILYFVYSERPFSFYSDNFKMVSRNINKLFRIVNFILFCHNSFLTANYYITDTYAEIRNPLIKPAHNVKEIKSNLRNVRGLSSKHLYELKLVAKNSQ